MKTKLVNNKNRGFSLLELAIALSVIALLTGGVLKGRSLLESARVQATATELTALETALTAFELRYNALPGDFEAASAAGLGSNGNGNNAIDTLSESGAAFHHLSQAGLIEGDFSEAELTGLLGCGSETCLTISVGGQAVLAHSKLLMNQKNNQLMARFTEPLPAKTLAELDRQIDDGKPNKGKLRVLASDAETCVINDNLWNEASEPICGAGYLL